MRPYAAIVGIGTALVLGTAASALQTNLDRPDRTYEGDWYVSDDTDNNTGERKVGAFQIFLKKDNPNYVTLRLQCSDGKPALFVEWDDLPLPAQAVLSFAPISKNGTWSQSPFMFEKHKDESGIDRGMRASPESSAAIVKTIGNSESLMLTAHLSSGERTVVMDIAGTQRAWARVVRHCPVRKMQRPPE